MIKNIIFDIGGVLAKEVSGRALVDLDATEQDQMTKMVYSNDSGFAEVLLGYKSAAEYADNLTMAHPKLMDEIHYLLDPRNLPDTYPVQPEVLALMRALHEKYKVYFLSNMIEMSFGYLQEILEEFDGGVYSFQEHVKKPNLDFFRTLLNRYQLDPRESIFFDDSEENVIAARALGMQAAVFGDTQSVYSFNGGELIR
jgi:putative hydrolase of the HAD superfamily